MMFNKYISGLTFFLLLWSFFQQAGYAQCYPDRHNTNWFNGWISCKTANNPNDAYGNSHWILYDLKDIYELGNMHVWNTNDPERLDFGMQEVSIDFSENGSDWQHLGDFVFDRGTGRSVYEGFEGPDFEGAVARYVLITGISNYGGDCYGLSEIRIAVEEHAVFATEPRFNIDCAGTKEGILLEWTVQGKLDEVHYQIERSVDSESWILLKKTDTYTLEEGTHTFHYIDNGTIEGSAYYRLIARSGAGTQQISDVHYCSQNKLDARIYPNPMRNTASLDIISNSQDMISVQISDLLGRELYQGAFTPQSLSTSLSLDQLNLLEGQYFVSVRQADEVKTIRLIRM